jgi:hypothetical protein
VLENPGLSLYHLKFNLSKKPIEHVSIYLLSIYVSIICLVIWASHRANYIMTALFSQNKRRGEREREREREIQSNEKVFL